MKNSLRANSKSDSKNQKIKEHLKDLRLQTVKPDLKNIENLQNSRIDTIENQVIDRKINKRNKNKQIKLIHEITYSENNQVFKELSKEIKQMQDILISHHKNSIIEYPKNQTE